MNVVSSFSFTEDKKQLLEEFKRIADREGKGRSELIIELVQEYVKNHSEGNSTFKIEDFQDPGFKAMPATASPMTNWTKYINENTDEKEDKELELKCLSIVGVIRDKRKNAKISYSV